MVMNWYTADRRGGVCWGGVGMGWESILYGRRFGKVRWLQLSAATTSAELSWIAYTEGVGAGGGGGKGIDSVWKGLGQSLTATVASPLLVRLAV